MRRLSIMVAALLLVAAPSAASAATIGVRIVERGFSPTSVTISVGDTVRWTNRDRVNHQIVAATGAFASPVLRPGQSYSFTFRAAGTYRYRDALEPAERGTVVVKGPPPSVTLAATVPIVKYGNETRLQGAVSSRRAGEPVEVLSQPYGSATFGTLTLVRTTAGGVFDLQVFPWILTNYQVRWRGVASAPVTIQVAPRITFVPIRRGVFRTRVEATPPPPVGVGEPSRFARRTVYLQRRSRFGQWVTVQRLRLGELGGKIFRLRPARTGTFRIFITVNQAGAGYLASWSGTQTIRVRRR